MRKRFIVTSALALLTVAFAPSAGAQPLVTVWDNPTYLTFSGPVGLPGITLPAGTYLFRFPARYYSHTAPSVIQVLSRDRSVVYAMLMTVPARRLTVAHDDVVTFKEARADTAPRIAAWFPANVSTGYEFLYPTDANPVRAIAMK